MFNLKQTMLFLLLLISASAWADDKLKVLYVGAPQSGPPIILTQSLAANLTVPYEFISMKDCASALRIIEQEKNVLFLMSDVTTMTGVRQNEECHPRQLRTRDIVGYTASSWHLCKKAGSNAKIGQDKFSLGVASILPVTGMVNDFNKLNGTKATGVALPSSAQVTAALLNGDIQWGMVNPGLSEPAMDEGKLECPMTFIPQGTAKVSKEKFVGNHYKMTVPFLYSAYFIVIKSTDTKIRVDVDKAVTGSKFNEFLTKSRYVGTKVGLGNFDDTDMDSYFGYINKLLTDLYSLPAYDWKKRI
jgi:hypothetical protein